MKKKTIIFIIIIVLLVFLYFLNDAYGRILLKEALHFPDCENAVATVQSYADDGSSLELNHEEKNILFDLIKEEARFAGYSSQRKITPIMREDDVYAVIITGDAYFSLFYLSEDPEKTVLCVNDRYIKIGKMRQAKNFVKKLFH